MTLDGRVALVTGAARGIGKAATLALAQAGADVAVVDLDGVGAEAVAGAVSALGRKAVAVVADVGDLTGIDGMVRRAVDALGRIDVLVNNAGVTRRAHLMELTEEDWDRIMRINAKGVTAPQRVRTRQRVASSR
jgi:NAD(P)-dependent dehydrogenase (short-subunit alcohol dehydrogenase family)